MYLRDRADKNGQCFPAISTIASDLKMSKSTVKRALSDLEKAHYIRHERRYRQSGGNSTNLYFVERPP
ncbi:MAG: helix-turn-helix domain-containing protein [Oscillospiraceae bacterium]|nr:helix-turn-helix domain-containing protein [Oscillospiraceae bacterium]